ncbi:MAG TPA: GSU2403 family nucleotidyltransferase fold protein [Steroidobacteraceae bacterium]|nr:GSU2403 family nucleotidyltransferase fold protein [Steroidobacteraceae bacterium]
MAPLALPHERALNLLFAELKATAEEQPEAFLGTPGNLTERTNGSGTKFWAHRYTDALGRRQEKYLGRSDDAALKSRLEQWRRRIEEANATIARIRVLARAGFATVDRKTYSTIASLFPSPGDDYPTIAIPELKAYAQGLPFLRYLLGESQQVPLLSPHGVVLVRVPVPERYAIHKLIVSQLRSRSSNKPTTDLAQAAVLIEAVAERFPGAIEAALAAAPRSTARYLQRAKQAVSRHLPASSEAAWQALS